MSTQITTQKILAFDNYAAFGSSTGTEGYIYIDNDLSEAYLWDADAAVFVLIGAYTPIPTDPLPLTFANAATVGPITPVPNYNNGPANDGVGATLIGGGLGALTDGSAPGKIDTNYTPIVGDIILVKNQPVSTNPTLNRAFQNGLYVINVVGDLTTSYQLTRVGDFDESSELYPLQVNVTEGNSNALKYFIQTTVNPNIGTSNLIFSVSNFQPPSLQVAFVDTVIDTPLSNIVYADGTTYPTIPGANATLTSTVFGPLGTYYGLTANTNPTVALGFTRVLLTNQANAAHNGDYSVIRPGSIYTSAAGATSIGTTISVASVAGLVVGMTVTVLSGTGAFAANTTVLSINTSLNRFVVSIAPTTPLSGGATVVRAGTTWQLRRIQIGASGFDRYTRYFMVSNAASTKAGKYYFTKPNSPVLTNNSSLAPFNTGIGIAPINIFEYGGSSTGPFGIANSSGVYTYYATMTLAMTAAGAGTNKTIEMFANVTETSVATITFPNEVTLNGNGHTYTFDTAGTVDVFNIPAFATCYLYDININLLTSTGSVIKTNNNTTLIGNATLISNSGSSYIVDPVGASSSINISGFTIVAKLSKNGVALANGSYATNLTIYSETGEGLRVGSSAKAFNCNVIASNPSNYAAYVFGYLANSVIYSYGGSSSTALGLQGSGSSSFPTGVYNCNIISLLGHGVFLNDPMDVDNTTIITYGTGKYAVRTDINASTTYTDFFNCTLKSINGPCVEQLLRWLSFTNCYLYAGAGSAIDNTGPNPGYDVIRLRRCFIEVAGSNASYHGVVLGTDNGSEITNCYFSVVNASSYAITALGAITAKCAQNAFKGSTVPINPLVTNISNIIDATGNVII